MTYKEILLLSFVLLAFGWAFNLVHRPDIALYFLFAAGGGFVWGEVKKRRARHDRP